MKRRSNTFQEKNRNKESNTNFFCAICVSNNSSNSICWTHVKITLKVLSASKKALKLAGYTTFFIKKIISFKIKRKCKNSSHYIQ